jgi:hypothetical protein
MRCFRELTFAAVIGLALVGGAVAAPKDGKAGEKSAEAGKKKDKKDKKGKAPEPEAKEDGKPKLALPLIEGNDSKGVKIPYYDAKGTLQMVFNIGVASRLDENRVKMSETQVETFNEAGEPEMTINLPISTLDLNTRVITSETKTTIKRDDFTITGDAVRFNTMTKEGTLVGNVHMTIYNLTDEVAPEPAAPANDEKATDAKPTGEKRAQ